MLRSFAGEYDRDFGEARIAEIRRLLDDPVVAGDGLTDRFFDVGRYPPDKPTTW